MACTSCKNKMAGTKKRSSSETKKRGKVGATKRRSARRKRKGIAGFADINFEAILGAIGGAYAAKMGKDYALDATPNKGIQFAKDNPQMVDYILFAAGIFAATQDNSIVTGAGYGMLAKSGSDIISGFMAEKPITGVGGEGQYDERGTENAIPDFIYGTDGQPVLQLNRGTGQYEPLDIAGTYHAGTYGEKVTLKVNGGF